jgi:hypothetical protein
VTISKGSSWGTPNPTPPETPFAATNAELFRLVQNGERVVALSGGDLWRTVGGAGAGERNRSRDPSSGLPVHFPVDLVSARLGGVDRGLFAAHLIGHNLTWSTIVAGMNVDFWRQFHLGPHAHPGDAVVDLYIANLRVSDLAKVWPRAKAGLHVPHPGISLQRASSVTVELPRPVSWKADDVKIGRARTAELTVQPDALTVIV